MPSEVIQKRLASVFDSLNDRIASSRQATRSLAALRDTLLPKLLSGELSVAEAETTVGRAL